MSAASNLLSEDHFPYLKAAPPTKDWTEVSVHPPSYEETVVGALHQLEEMLSKEMKKLIDEAELKRIQKFAVDMLQLLSTGCSFNEKLFPYFSPWGIDGGKNSAPLIICPVNQTE
ncbi:hypothetical protein VZT92_003220 [Zoarces viviparus]|uniref:Uncharacterized protein n=1 Tax=Zoarces viviparus TaxID=48416 RepID=A0AAW1G1U8_ZOAVI